MKWIRGTVAKRHVWSEGLFTLSIHVPGVEPFKPGQFLQVGMDIEGEKHLHRPYSVASPHGDTLEFFIVMVENGALTPKLWSMNAGDSIDVSQRAAGSFTLAHTPDADCLWLVGTGTGLAPYIAMLRTEEPWDRYRKIILLHGVRYARDLAYEDELASFTNRYPGRFQFLPVVSREKTECGLSGRITNCLGDGSLEAAVHERLAADTSAIMLCGNPDMLDEMELILENRGMQRHKSKQPGQLVVERYW